MSSVKKGENRTEISSDYTEQRKSFKERVCLSGTLGPVLHGTFRRKATTNYLLRGPTSMAN